MSPPATPMPLFADKNVGTGKTISVTGISITGADAGNYQLSGTTASATADITAKALTVSATGINKAYDGTTEATVTLSTDKMSGDDVTASHADALFTDKNVGTGKTITVTGISITGADAGNYDLAGTDRISDGGHHREISHRLSDRHRQTL